MKTRLLVSLLVLLASCSTDVALIRNTDEIIGHGVLSLSLLDQNRIEVLLEGKVFAGEWNSLQCSIESCRDIYSQYRRSHRRHFHTGQAVLHAQDGTGMECSWISHLSSLDGFCITMDGDHYALKNLIPSAVNADYGRKRGA